MHTNAGSAVLAPLPSEFDGLAAFVNQYPQLSGGLIAITAGFIGLRAALAGFSVIGLMGKGGMLMSPAFGLRTLTAALTGLRAVAIAAPLAALAGGLGTLRGALLGLTMMGQAGGLSAVFTARSTGLLGLLNPLRLVTAAAVALRGAIMLTRVGAALIAIATAWKFGERAYSHLFSSATTSDLSSFSYAKIDIGDPHPDRRLILHFEGAIRPSGTLNQVCAVKGATAALIHADLPNRFFLSSSFSLYAIRDAIFVSEPVPDGNTASVVFTNGLTNDVMGVNIMKCIGLRPAIEISLRTTSVTRRIRARGLATVKCRTQNSAESISNATKRFRLLAGGWHHSLGEYINETEAEQDVTFTSATGSEFDLRVFS